MITAYDAQKLRDKSIANYIKGEKEFIDYYFKKIETAAKEGRSSIFYTWSSDKENDLILDYFRQLGYNIIKDLVSGSTMILWK